MTLNDVKNLYNASKRIYEDIKELLVEEMKEKCKCPGCLNIKDCWNRNFELLCYPEKIGRCLNRK